MRSGSAFGIPCLLTFALMALCTSSLGGRAAEPAKVARAIFLFDGSGSMWGKLNGQSASKLRMAQAALRKSIPALRLPLHLGLMTFGNRQTRSCEDVRALVSPAADGGQRILQAVPNFNPQGRGPLTLGMRKAAQELKAGQGPASIILIHDGPDNCGQDPCAAVSELKVANGDLVIHVISLVPGTNDAKRISCVSSATGGRHYIVLDQAGLDAAVQQTLKLAALRSGAPVRASQSPVAKAARPDDGKPGLRLSVMLMAGGPPIAEGLRWRIVPGSSSGKAKGKVAPVYEGVASQPFLDLKPGIYSVTVRLGQLRASSDYKVAEKGKTTANLILNAGIIRLRTVRPRDAVQINGVSYTVTRQTKGATGPRRALIVSDVDAPTFYLPTGSYIVKSQRGLARVEQAVTIQPGSIANIDLVLNMGELAVSASAAKGAAPEKGVYFFVYDDRTAEADNPQQVARSGAMQPIFALPAGTYRVHARYGETETIERISVQAGRRTTRVMLLGLAKLRLSSRLSGADMSLDGLVSYRIVRLDEREAEIVRTTQDNPVLLLAAGRYRIEGRLGEANAVETLTVTLGKGADQRFSMEHQAGIVKLRLSAIQHGLALADVFWDITGPDGRVVWSSGQAEPRVPLRTGRYKVAVERRGKRWERLVDVVSGESQTIELLIR